MTKPNSFILSTDYATLKNDAKGTASVTMPGGLTVPAGSFVSYATDIELGSIGAGVRSRIASSKDSGVYYPVSMVNHMRNGVSGGMPTTYSVYAVLSRISATTIRFTTFIQNPYMDDLFCEAGDEVFTCEVNTFIAPF